MYLKKMDVPDKYIDVISSVPSKEIHWITQREYETDFSGYIPEMRKLLGSQCAATANSNRNTETSKSATVPAIRGDDSKTLNLPPHLAPDVVGCWLTEREKMSNEAWTVLFNHR